jgi:hypothetical protein
MQDFNNNYVAGANKQNNMQNFDKEIQKLLNEININNNKLRGMQEGFDEKEKVPEPTEKIVSINGIEHKQISTYYFENIIKRTKIEIFHVIINNNSNVCCVSCCCNNNFFCCCYCGKGFHTNKIKKINIYADEPELQKKENLPIRTLYKNGWIIE